jgi:ethanolaminephosphotransferase
LTKLTRHE